MTPYDGRPSKSFWKPGVAQADPFDIESLWIPRFSIGRSDLVLTAGSCFAQNIGHRLRAEGLRWLETEPAPVQLPRSQHAQNGYGIFSFRTGNIYTTPLLLQWIRWALSLEPQSTEVWEEQRGCFDPFRPSVISQGFETKQDVLASRTETLKAMRNGFKDATLFIFTLGLTEAWINSKTGNVYPACPGTLCGTFDKTYHTFRNFTVAECANALSDTIELLSEFNPRLKILLTVSPIPITATMTEDHVLAANTRSKSVLRAVCAETVDRFSSVDYFPSYELIGNPKACGQYFAENFRSLNEKGLTRVMAHFFQSIGHSKQLATVPEGDVVCDDEILDYYAPLS